MLAALVLLCATGCTESPCSDGCPTGQRCVAELCRSICVLHSDCSTDELCYQGYCERGDLKPGGGDFDGSGDDGEPSVGDPQTGDPTVGDPQTGDSTVGDPQTGDPGPDICGNDRIDNGEACDGSDLGETTTCVLAGWAGGGPLTCMETCALRDLSACTGSPGNCNGTGVSGRQQCDGAELRGETCESLGFSGGTLTCTAHCTYDVSGCSSP